MDNNRASWTQAYRESDVDRYFLPPSWEERALTNLRGHKGDTNKIRKKLDDDKEDGQDYVNDEDTDGSNGEDAEYDNCAAFLATLFQQNDGPKEGQKREEAGKSDQIDAIFILGGGPPKYAHTVTNHRLDGGDSTVTLEVVPYVRSRLAIAHRVYQCHRQTHADHTREETDNVRVVHQMPSASSPSFLTLSAGTAHTPQLNNANGLPVWESFASAHQLHAAWHVPKDRIYLETVSYDTIGNAYFARVLHADPWEWRKIVVVSSRFHMQRSKVIFDWVFSLPYTSSVPSSSASSPYSSSSAYALTYIGAPDTGLDTDSLIARRDKERKSSDFVADTLSKRISSLQELHHWLTTEHSMYAFGRMDDAFSVPGAGVLRLNGQINQMIYARKAQSLAIQPTTKGRGDGTAARAAERGEGGRNTVVKNVVLSGDEKLGNYHDGVNGNGGEDNTGSDIDGDSGDGVDQKTRLASLLKSYGG